MNEAYELLEQAYNLLYELNNNTNDMNAYFKGVGVATQLVAEALDKLGETK